MSPVDGDDADKMSPQALSEDQISGVMYICANGNVHELEKYVIVVCVLGLMRLDKARIRADF